MSDGVDGQENLSELEIAENWLLDHRDIGLESISLLSESDFQIYQQFELRRLFEDVMDYDLTPAFSIYRDKEYNYDSKDHCYCCGYFEPNEYDSKRYWYCTKFGSDTNPTSQSCDISIVI